MATALELIKGALRRINSYQSGEPLSTDDQNDCLVTLNDLLDSWSTDKMHIYGTNEYLLQWVTGKNQYLVGNPTCTSIGEANIVGTIASGSPTITAVTIMPKDIAVGATLTDSYSGTVIPAGTTVLAFNAGAQTITMSANALAVPANNPEQITYTIPGDFAIPRPLRITGGYTRINALDFTLDVQATQDQYNTLLYKAQPGPWPTMAWYNPQMPYGILHVYQTPGQGGELHLFTDTILQNLALTQTFILPQGYARALKWCLALEIAPEYGKPVTIEMKKNADMALKMIKALNAQPAARAKYDRALIQGDRPDGSWIFTGGYG